MQGTRTQRRPVKTEIATGVRQLQEADTHQKPGRSKEGSSWRLQPERVLPTACFQTRGPQNPEPIVLTVSRSLVCSPLSGQPWETKASGTQTPRALTPKTRRPAHATAGRREEEKGMREDAGLPTYWVWGEHDGPASWGAWSDERLGRRCELTGCRFVICQQ